MTFDWKDQETVTPNEQDAVQMLSELQDIWTQTKEQIAKSQQLQIR